MTKSGSDHLKHRARAIARVTGRRFPDVLAELRTGPGRPKPSTALVPVCSGSVGVWGDMRRCRRPAGHLKAQDFWAGTCSSDPHYCEDIEAGYRQAQLEAEEAAHQAWLAAMSPAERERHEQDLAEEYAAEMAVEMADAYDPEEERYWEAVEDAADEERWAAEAETRDGVVYGPDEDFDVEGEYDYGFEER
ncbi:hypothetical protein ABZY81_43385 [Streptomyces sp. NPDC006514]|uniref:hypothetical protein n=1 Tax=Streptomyces sp. NPDC006514 TaxID=3154308 RepID=UPI0033BABEBC